MNSIIPKVVQFSSQFFHYLVPRLWIFPRNKECNCLSALQQGCGLASLSGASYGYMPPQLKNQNNQVGQLNS